MLLPTEIVDTLPYRPPILVSAVDCDQIMIHPNVIRGRIRTSTQRAERSLIWRRCVHAGLAGVGGTGRARPRERIRAGGCNWGAEGHNTGHEDRRGGVHV